MRRTICKGLVILAAAAMSLVLVPPAAANADDAPANNSAALSVSPPTSSIDVAPGQKYTKKIGIDNISDITRNLSIEVHNFAANGEDGEAKLTEDQGVYSLKEWIKVTPSTATVPAHGHQDFQVEISVPANAPPGGHFGAVVFSPSAGNASGGASLSVVSQVTSLILLRVPGDAKEAASIQSFNVCNYSETAKTAQKCQKSKSLFTNGPVSFATRIQNSGNVQVMPTGTVTVRNILGKKVATIPVTGANVLPDSVRRFDTKWPNKHPFGQYKISIDLKYGDTGQSLTAAKSFWVIPFSSVLIVVGVILALFIFVWLPRKRLKKAFKALASSDD